MPGQVDEPRTQPVSGVEIRELVGLFNAGRYVELEAQARKLTARDPSSGLAWKVLGAALGVQGKDALPALQRSAELSPGDAEAHNNLGNALCGLGQLDAAVASCGRALQINPNFAEAHNNLGTALLGLGQLEAALASCRRALQLKPALAEAHNNLGNALLELAQPEEAVASYRRALQLKPQYAEAHSNLGHALLRLGQHEEAAAGCRRAIELKPQYAEAHNNLGHALLKLGQLEEAVASCRRAIELKPQYAEAHSNLGHALRELGQFEDAASSCRRAIELKPQYAEAHNNLGNALLGSGQLEQAAGSYGRALQINPNFAEAHNNLGNVLLGLGQLEAAVASYRRALEISPQYAEAHNNLGNAFATIAQDPNDIRGDCDRNDFTLEPTYLEQALASYDQAIALKPDYAEAYSNRANSLMESGQFEAALANYDRAIALSPDFAGSRYSRSMLLLLRGDFDRGWFEHEWRWKNNEGWLKLDRRHAQPTWLGKESIAGKSILLYGEQGLGDTLQFCRYAKLVAGLGATVILEVQQPLSGLLAALEGVSQVAARGTTLPGFDYQCPLMSLPLAFKTSLGSIPTAAKYLAADANKVSQWQRKLGEKTTARIGLAWQGNPIHKDDRKRSIALAELIRHLPVGPQYVSLHKDVSEADRQLLESTGILQFSDDMDITGTAALCECLDLLISVDTSMVHLGGALGRSTWVLLSFIPDWRWLLDRDDSPWYPAVRLFRQRRRGDWSDVLERVKANLIQRFELRG